MTVEELKKFCGDDEGKYDFSKPFRRGKFIYAGDRRMMLRIPANGDKTFGEGERTPPTEKLDWDCTQHPLTPWPEAEYIFERKMTKCDDCENEYSAWEQTKIQQKLGPTWIATELHYAISLLPNPQLRMPLDPNRAIYFRFDGGEGLVMPMREILNK